MAPKAQGPPIGGIIAGVLAGTILYAVPLLYYLSGLVAGFIMIITHHGIHTERRQRFLGVVTGFVLVFSGSFAAQLSPFVGTSLVDLGANIISPIWVISERVPLIVAVAAWIVYPILTSTVGAKIATGVINLNSESN